MGDRWRRRRRLGLLLWWWLRCGLWLLEREVGQRDEGVGGVVSVVMSALRFRLRQARREKARAALLRVLLVVTHPGFVFLVDVGRVRWSLLLLWGRMRLPLCSCRRRFADRHSTCAGRAPRRSG